jgi:hypothetical protein
VPVSRVFVGVGVGVDPLSGNRLDRAVADVREFRRLLGGDFVGKALIDPKEQRVRRQLEDLPAMSSGGGMAVMWRGHAIQSAWPGGIGLLA